MSSVIAKKIIGGGKLLINTQLAYQAGVGVAGSCISPDVIRESGENSKNVPFLDRSQFIIDNLHINQQGQQVSTIKIPDTSAVLYTQVNYLPDLRSEANHYNLGDKNKYFEIFFPKVYREFALRKLTWINSTSAVFESDQPLNDSTTTATTTTSASHLHAIPKWIPAISLINPFTGSQDENTSGEFENQEIYTSLKTDLVMRNLQSHFIQNISILYLTSEFYFSFTNIILNLTFFIYVFFYFNKLILFKYSTLSIIPRRMVSKDNEIMNPVFSPFSR